MKRQITLDISPATATHCGDGRGRCDKLDAGYQCCDAFPRRRHDPEFDHDMIEYKRIPECLAAEQKGNQ